MLADSRVKTLLCLPESSFSCNDDRKDSLLQSSSESSLSSLHGVCGVSSQSAAASDRPGVVGGQRDTGHAARTGRNLSEGTEAGGDGCNLNTSLYLVRAADSRCMIS